MKSVKTRPVVQQYGHSDKNYIAVMGKAFTVMEYLTERSDTQELVSFSRISQDLPFSRTAIHRILYSLGRLGYVEKSEASQYRLAAKFFLLTGPVAHFRRLQSSSTSVMYGLLVRHGETVNLAALNGGEVAYIDVRPSLSQLRTVSVPGDRNPAHCTALGKAILAFLPEPEIDAFFTESPLIRKTPKTITRKGHFLQHLALVREQGVALDMEENTIGVTCAAAPILDQTGRPVAALSLSGPTVRIAPKLNVIKNDLRAATRLISRTLAPVAKSETLSTRKSRNNAIFGLDRAQL